MDREMQRSCGSESSAQRDQAYFLVAAGWLGRVSADLTAALSRHPWSGRVGLLLCTASRKREAGTETGRRGQVLERAQEC